MKPTALAAWEEQECGALLEGHRPTQVGVPWLSLETGTVAGSGSGGATSNEEIPPCRATREALREGRAQAWDLRPRWPQWQRETQQDGPERAAHLTLRGHAGALRSCGCSTAHHLYGRILEHKAIRRPCSRAPGHIGCTAVLLISVGGSRTTCGSGRPRGCPMSPVGRPWASPVWQLICTHRPEQGTAKVPNGAVPQGGPGVQLPRVLSMPR